MKKLYSFNRGAAAVAAALGLALSAQASVPMQLQGAEFNVDTLEHFYIGPGVTHTHLRYAKPDGSRQFNAYVVAMDLNAEGADRIRPKVEIGRDSCKTGEAITSMAARKTSADAQYLAGINGDFFITSSFAAQHEFGNAILGYPNMACATDGKLAAPDEIDKVSRENALIIGGKGEMWIDATALKYVIMNNDGSSKINATSMNYPRRAEELVVYNSFAGGWTKTEQAGRELVLRLAPGAKWALNKSVKLVVDKEWRQGGNSAIPADGIVISAGANYSNSKMALLDTLKVGDTIKLKITCSLPAFGVKPSTISEICGGDVRILKENVTTTEAIRWINTPGSLYSRSMVGYSQDRSRLYLCAVDAGTTGNSGVSYYEGADLMRNLGCWDALDLDGGGSTALWTASHGFVNTLRDGSERAVGNGIFVRLDAPADSRVASIRFMDWVRTLPKYGSYRPVIYGYNQYGQLVDKDVKGVTLEAPAALGTVSEDGTILMASGQGTHALTARLGEMSAQIAVTVDASFPTLPRVENVLLDNITPWQAELQARAGTEMMAVSPLAFTWASDNEAVLQAASDGPLTGKADGTAIVTGTNDSGAKVAMNVTVECPKAMYAPVRDGAAAAADWKTSGTGTKNIAIAPNGQHGGIDLKYSVSSTRGTKVTATCKARIWSRPDALRITVDPQTSSIKTLTLSLITSNAQRALTLDLDGPFEAGKDNTFTVNLSDFKGIDLGDIAAYPVTLNSLAFSLNGKTGNYTLAVPAIEAVYSGYTSGVESITAGTEADTRLSVTRSGDRLLIPFMADCISLYDMQGRLVARNRHADSIEAPLAKGMYVVRAEFAGSVRSAKVGL